MTRTAAILILAAAVMQAQPRTFDVASIKPNNSGSESRRATSTPGGQFTAVNVTVKLLISRAYGVAEAQIQGGPSWLESETFDISAKADTTLELTREQMRPCLQALLAQRFQLKVHHETKEGSIYSMMPAKNGPKLNPHQGAGLPGISVSSDDTNTRISGTNATLALLAEYLSGLAGRPVIDNTGLKGVYDFQVQWTSSESPFTALQEQLGLQLEATKGPIDFITIDQVQRPSPN